MNKFKGTLKRWHIKRSGDGLKIIHETGTLTGVVEVYLSTTALIVAKTRNGDLHALAV